MGVRAYGWDDDGVTVREAEANVLRNVATKLLGGQSMRRVVAQLNASGVTTATGKKWHISPLKRALLNPRIAGRKSDTLGRLTRAQHSAQPILDEDTFRKVRALLNDPARARSAPKNEGPLLLSGIAVCGLCGDNLMSAQPKRYACRNADCGGVTIQQHILDTEVGQRVVERLATQMPVWAAEAGETPVTVAQWWLSSSTAQRRELLAVLVEQVQVFPVTHDNRVSMNWNKRYSGDALVTAWAR